jgi:tetratricopeptide (TPR) repeat protein
MKQNRIVHYILLVLSIATFFQCSQNKVDDLWDQALAADSLGNSGEAITAYNELLKTDLTEEGKVIAFTNRGRAKISSGDTLNGIADLDKALSINPLYKTLLSRAMVEVNLNKALALEYLHKAKSLAPSEPIVYYSLLGYYSFTMPAKDSALYYADYVFTHFELNTMGSEQLMSTYLNYRQYDKLKTITDLIIRNNPSHAYAYNNRGFAKMNLGGHQSAREDINRSIMLDPENSYAFKNLGILFLKTNKVDSACLQFSKASNMGYKKLYGGEVDSLLNVHCK